MRQRLKSEKVPAVFSPLGRPFDLFTEGNFELGDSLVKYCIGKVLFIFCRKAAMEPPRY